MRWLAFGLALFPLAAASAQSLSQERLVSPRLPDFTIGFYRANAANMIREEVPRGQTVQAWTKMVTTQRFGGLAARTTPEAYARTILGNVPTSCPGARLSPVRGLSLSGRPAAQIRIDCPSNPAAGGKAETFILLAVAGTADMHVKQVAFRGGLGRGDAAWAQSFLSGVAFCRANDKAPACTR